MSDAAGTAQPIAPLQPHIEGRILALRGQRVMLDADLAALYGVPTKVLVQAVKRNAQRFPADFMFQLTAQEWEVLRLQSVTSNTANDGACQANDISGRHQSGEGQDPAQERDEEPVRP